MAAQQSLGIKPQPLPERKAPVQPPKAVAKPPMAAQPRQGEESIINLMGKADNEKPIQI